MREIPLTQGKVALVDDADYDWLMQWKWYTDKNETGRMVRYYAVRNAKPLEGLLTCRIRMHKALCPQWIIIDHKDRNGLNNQRHNLRDGSGSKNNQNQSFFTNNTSGFKGVTWHKCTSKWEAQIGHNHKNIHLGVFETKQEAARAYAIKAIELWGDYCPSEIVAQANI